MKYLDLTLPSPAENLACDEALLDVCEELGALEVLRFHTSPVPCVIAGFGNRLAAEVDLEASAAEGVPVLRRSSGGGTVVLGPGCLAYALVLSIERRPELGSVTATNRWVMEVNRRALEGLLGRPVTVEGFTDLAVDGRKVSGNAQRRRRRCLLFHGTLLLDFDLALAARLLRRPSVEPEYRSGRSHLEFLTNLGIPEAVVKSSLRQAWEADAPWEAPLAERIEALVRERYGQATWNARR